MDIAVKQFYERYIDRLIEAEKKGEVEYQAVKDGFFLQLEEHLDHAQRLNDIVADLKSVSQRLFFIDDRIKERANSTYKDIPAQLKGMGDMLKSAFEKMDLSIKNEDCKEACKYVVIQAEIISEYLFAEFDLINTWIKPDAARAVKYGLKKSGKGVWYVTTWFKLTAARDFCNHTWDDGIINIVKDIRDYGSHGYHESDLKKQAADVVIVSKDYKRYFNEWFKFILAVKTKLYSNILVATAPATATAPAEKKQSKKEFKIMSGHKGAKKH